jgi:HTH-type transcriptional regulator, global nitrogen regulator NrpRI
MYRQSIAGNMRSNLQQKPHIATDNRRNKPFREITGQTASAKKRQFCNISDWVCGRDGHYTVELPERATTEIFPASARFFYRVLNDWMVMDKKDRNRAVILAALQKLDGPASSSSLMQFLAAGGHNLSERTLRLYLGQLDAEGLITAQGRRRRISAKGLAELHATHTYQRVGYLSAKIDQMAYSMSFDLLTRTGLVVVNLSIVDPRQLCESVDLICKVFDKGYAMGSLLAVLPPGDSLGSRVVPPGRVGFCTVCSITLNGILMKHGVPTTSRFGGLLELREGRPTRFVEMIHYDGTSIDPLEVFIRSGMTDYCGAVADGNGLIGAGFREMPGNSRNLIMQLAERVSAVGLGGFMEIGWPDQPVLDLPVSPGRIGVVMVGGLNPIAILEEKSYRVDSRALAGLLDYNSLIHYDDLPKALADYL